MSVPTALNSTGLISHSFSHRMEGKSISDEILVFQGTRQDGSRKSDNIIVTISSCEKDSYAGCDSDSYASRGATGVLHTALNCGRHMGCLLSLEISRSMSR